jgi:hypothetical protein
LSQVQAQLGNEQVKDELEKQKTQVKAQFTELLKDEQKYQQAIENPQVPKEQKEWLKKFKANPQELDKFISQQSDPNQSDRFFSYRSMVKVDCDRFNVFNSRFGKAKL